MTIVILFIITLVALVVCTYIAGNFNYAPAPTNFRIFFFLRRQDVCSPYYVRTRIIIYILTRREDDFFIFDTHVA